MRKKGVVFFVAAALSAAMSISAFAAGWQGNAETGWWYSTNADNSEWYSNGWQWIDGNGDGIAECYYFDGNGYALTNTTTPDGYTVNADGAWMVNGVVQTKQIGVTQQTGQSASEVVYDQYGMNVEAKEMLNNTREQNAKFGEVRVDEDINGPCVYYANGLMVFYPQSYSSMMKLVQPADTSDSTVIFKYFVSGLNGKEASDYLHSIGFGDGSGAGEAYYVGDTCRIFGETSMLWMNNFCYMQTALYKLQ